MPSIRKIKFSKADKQAIKFANWLNNNHYTPTMYDAPNLMWRLPEITSQERFTTAQVYKKFTEKSSKRKS